MRKERIGLKHHGGAAFDRRKTHDLLAANEYFAMGRVFVARNHAQKSSSCRSRMVRESSNMRHPKSSGCAVDNRGDAVIALDDPCQFDASIRDRHTASHSLVGRWSTGARFWIRAMVPRQTPMMTNEIRVVTVPRA